MTTYEAGPVSVSGDNTLSVWREHGHATIDAIDGSHLGVEATDDDEFGHVLTLDAWDLGNAAGVILSRTQALALLRIVADWLAPQPPAASGAAGSTSLDPAREEAAASSEHQTP